MDRKQGGKHALVRGGRTNYGRNRTLKCPSQEGTNSNWSFWAAPSNRLSRGDKVDLFRTYKEEGLDLSKSTNRKDPQMSVLPLQLAWQVKAISSKGVTDLITNLHSIDGGNLESNGTTTVNLNITVGNGRSSGTP